MKVNSLFIELRNLMRQHQPPAIEGDCLRPAAQVTQFKLGINLTH